MGFVQDIKSWFGSDQPVKKKRVGKFAFDASKVGRKN